MASMWRKGMHFLLYDNVWGTNFPMWFGEDARFRFVLRVGETKAAQATEADSIAETEPA